ncbi:MAG: PRC-barrel domain-containing protein [Candidatus Aenigmarchaeota archaeon]|jgi:sporulation protein YlmC with PRC-barrel domain|nr:PRC-barrel domain-containing protein [Candidatus Aenigmarchaeota archaeon]
MPLKNVRVSEMIGKQIISAETGKKLGTVASIEFIVETGELLNIVVEGATKTLMELNVKTDSKGRPLIPFSAVKSVGDFVVVTESELI